MSISNNVDGDAPRSIVTMSRVTHRDPVATKVVTVVKPAVSLFLEDWVSVAHALLHTGWEVLVEVAEAWRQRWQGVQPRVNRGGVYPLVRATTTGALVDISIHTVLATMLRGAPAAYATFVSYEEVAHHSGPQSPDALRVLRALDRKFAVLEQAARLAPRPYRFVILSDHGQSHGAPFRQRYGQTLAHVVQSLVSDRHQVAPVETGPEALGHSTALLADLSRVNNSLGRLIQRLFKNRMPGGQLDISPQGNAGATDTEHAAATVVVCVSGNLAWRQAVSNCRPH